jgi:hypothetical protein
MERPRLLHGKSQFGYTDRLEEALPEEPEAVSSDEQRRLTHLATARAHELRLADWMIAKARLEEELDWLRHRPVGQEHASDLRVIQRQLDRIDRRLRIAG